MPEVLSFPPPAARQSTASPSPMPLTVRNLSFQAGGTPILNNVDLDLESDALTVLMGPNGAGKSILLRLLHGLLAPSSGSIRWSGKPLDKALRRQQALVFQKPVLLRRSVEANLKFALRLRYFSNRAAKLDRALEESGLDHLAKRQARVLSGGEQQRLALARALILEPKVLLLDEPTANLDPASTLIIEQAINRARQQGVKIILITHDQHQARRLGEEVVFLHAGQVTERTSAGTFFETPQSTAARAYLAGNIVI
jgi:tungstate transport system ATP-binding protein